MIRTLTLATVAALGSLGTTAVVAADQQVSFDSLDKNADGKVSLNEASTNDALFVAFESLDGNKDGELTKEEFAKFKGAKQ